MTARCMDCGSDRIHDPADDWTHGRVPVCPHCSALLYDEVGKPLAVDATRGYCHSWHVFSRSRRSSFDRSNWQWRDAANYPDAYMPVGEVAEMAANAEPVEQPLDEVQR